MSLTIELSTDEEVELRQAAERYGVRPEEWARRMLFAAGASNERKRLQIPAPLDTHEEMTEQRRDWDRGGRQSVSGEGLAQ